MRREIIRDDIPAPGALLRNESHPENQRVMAAEIQRRREIASARLGRWQLRRLKKRQKNLARRLLRSGYNDLIQQRAQLWEKLISLRAEVTSCCDRLRPLVVTQGRNVIAQGRDVNAKLQPLLPLAKELESITHRIEAHEQALRFEREDKENHAAFRREALTWLEQMRVAFARSERCRHRWEDERGIWHTDVPEIQHIYFKDDKVMYLVKTTEQTWLERLLGRWHSALPDNVDVSDLVSDETLMNLSAATRRRVTVEWSKRGTSFFYVIHRLDSPDGIPHKVLYSSLIDWYPEDEHWKTPWFAGVSDDRQVVTFTFEEQPHVLIAGSTQSGKSNHVNQMIALLVTMNSPDEVVINLIDLKGGVEFIHWANARHLMNPVAKTPEAAIESLRIVREIMESRLALFERVRAKKLSEYNRKSSQPMPRIITFIDEMATLLGLGETTAEYHSLLRVISSQGRAVGIHLVLCTQHSSVDVLPGWIKTNMTLRVSGRMPSVSASQVILDTITAATLPDVPGRLVFSVGRRERICQSPFISESEIARAVSLTQRYSAPVAIDAPRPKPKQPDFGREDVIRLALSSYDGKLSATQMWRDGLKDSGVIGWLKLIDVVNSIRNEAQIEFEGRLYNVQTTRGGGRQLVLSSNHSDASTNAENDIEVTAELEVAS